jgi:hypothetical protein
VENGLKIKTKAPAEKAGGKRTELAGTGGGPEGHSERAMGGRSGVKLKMDHKTNGRGFVLSGSHALNGPFLTFPRKESLHKI